MTVAAVVLFMLPVVWASYWLYTRMIAKSNLDFGLAGSGSMLPMSADERRTRAERGREEQRRLARRVERFWPLAAASLMAAVVLVTIAS